MRLPTPCSRSAPNERRPNPPATAPPSQNLRNAQRAKAYFSLARRRLRCVRYHYRRRTRRAYCHRAYLRADEVSYDDDNDGGLREWEETRFAREDARLLEEHRIWLQNFKLGLTTTNEKDTNQTKETTT